VSEHTSPQDVLQSSELAARLLRRLVASPGVIDTRRVFKTYAHLTKFITQGHPLLHDLLARYSIDDESAAQNLPLVMDQPWMLNLNTYLTNNSSSSSTTTNNSFLAGSTINQSILQSTTSSSTNTQLFGATTQPVPSEKFRITRRPPDSQPNVPIDSHEDVLNPLPKRTESLTLVKSQDRKNKVTNPAPSPAPTSTNLILAQTTITPRVIHTDQSVKSVFIRGEKTFREVRHSATSESIETRQQINTTERAVTQPTVPLVQEQLSPQQFQSRPPQLIWRKNADNQSLRDFVADVSSSSSRAAVRQALDSLPATQMPQMPANAQFSKPESSSRVDESSTVEEITTEGMLRRISKMLLIERERRGY
jgi:hypothetical protein